MPKVDANAGQQVVIEETQALPKAVRDAAAKSEALVGRVNSSQQATSGASPLPNLVSSAPSAEPIAPVHTPAPASEAAPAQPLQVTLTGNAPNNPSDGGDESWQHKYNSLKGHFDRVNRDNRTLLDRNRELEGVIATMHAFPAAAPAAPVASPTTTRLVTEQEVQEYGDEFLSVVGKKAKEEFLPEITQLRAEVDQLRGRVSGVGQHIVNSARDQFFIRLDNEVPGWKELNRNTEFLDWLDLPDPFSGAIRKQLLDAAVQRNDATRAAAFFKGFISDEAATRPANIQPDPAAKLAPKVPLESLAAPGRAKTVATEDVPTEKPTFTRAEISQFYADVAAGKYRGHEAEKSRIEAMIFEAGRERRVL